MTDAVWDHEQIALARRAVACRGWRWMPGMFAWRPDCPPVRVVAIEDAGNALQENGWLPDLSDPATLGCILALVREAWGNKHLWVEVGVDPAMWSLTVYSIGWARVDGEVPIPPDIQAEGEAEALVAALEAAP